jgi:hypothetical protein
MNRIWMFAPAAMLAASPALAQELTPGMWEHSSTVKSMEMPGAPAGMAAGMTGQTTVTSSCLTAEQLAEGPEALFNQSEGQCSYDNFEMGGGRVAITGSCAAPGGQGNLQMVASGTYTDTTYESQSTISMAMPGGEMKIEAEGSGRRTGDC